MDTLGDLILSRNASAYCMYAASDNPDMRYVTRFVTHDPVPVVCRPGKRPIMIVPQMETERAQKESPCEIITRAQAGYYEIAEYEKSAWNITAEMILRIAGEGIIIPPSFPAGLAKVLEKKTQVWIDYDQATAGMRSIKKSEELQNIITAQRAAEAAMDRAVHLMRNASVNNGILMNGEKPLTSESIRYEMHSTMLSLGCTAQDTIVACGEDTSMPHCTGSGPLRAHQPIVIDVFPRSDASGYHADMTRTFSRGEPDTRVKELYETVKEAVRIGENGLIDGANGAELYTKVKDYFTECGYPSGTEGFTHSLGHGVGLEIHEQPSLSPMGNRLFSGNVVTIEPGLYFRGIGGVRIENLLHITKTGFERITRYPEEMIL